MLSGAFFPSCICWALRCIWCLLLLLSLETLLHQRCGVLLMLLQARRVDYEDLAALVAANAALWDIRPLYREAQALLLYRLLQVWFVSFVWLSKIDRIAQVVFHLS